MPVRNAYLHVVVEDGKGNRRSPGADDRVMVDGAALPYDSAKGFVHKLNGKKDIRLDIKFKGFAGLRQWFGTEAPASRPRLDPFWPGTDEDSAAADRKREGYLLECMTAHRDAGGAGADRSASVFTITVHLFQTREYVAVIGADYFLHGRPSGLPFSLYARTFADHIYERNLANRSSPFVMIDCQRGVEERWMRAHNLGWRRHSILLRKAPAPRWPSARSFEGWLTDVAMGIADVRQYLGATDIYRYLSDKGDRRPGTVAEFSIFSHAYYLGPILYNTSGSTGAARSDRDLDLRAKQDFVSPNVNGWPKVKDAFASGANIHIWGCNANVFLHDMVYWLFTTHNPAARFRRRIKKKKGSPILRLDLSRDEVKGKLKGFIDDPQKSYMRAIANYTGRVTWGGPPGFGSEWFDYMKLTAIPKRLRSAIQKKTPRGTKPLIMNIPKTRSPRDPARKVYESAELGSQKFSWFGYMRYQP